jgi:hypothetical protein
MNRRVFLFVLAVLMIVSLTAYGKKASKVNGSLFPATRIR